MKKGYEMKSVHGGFSGDVHVSTDWLDSTKGGTMSISFYSGGSGGGFDLDLPDFFHEMGHHGQKRWADEISEKVSKIVSSELKKADEKIMALVKKNIKSIKETK